MFRITKISMLLAALLLGGSSQHVFGVGGRPVLCVPESDLDPLLISYEDESMHLHAGSGHTPGFAFIFRPEIMKNIVTGYDVVPGFDAHPYVNALSGTIGFLGEDDKGRLGSAMRARDIKDEWYSKGDCHQPAVTHLEGTKLYEVRCGATADYSAIWNRMPDVKIAMPNANEFVVATCNYKNITIGPYNGKHLSDCSRVFIIDKFIVDYRFQESNARVIPEIDAMIRKKISEWKMNCSS